MDARRAGRVIYSWTFFLVSKRHIANYTCRAARSERKLTCTILVRHVRPSWMGSETLKSQCGHFWALRSGQSEAEDYYDTEWCSVAQLLGPSSNNGTHRYRSQHTENIITGQSDMKRLTPIIDLTRTSTTFLYSSISLTCRGDVTTLERHPDI